MFIYLHIKNIFASFLSWPYCYIIAATTHTVIKSYDLIRKCTRRDSFTFASYNSCHRTMKKGRQRGRGWGKEAYSMAVSEIYYVPWHNKIKTHCNESLYFMLLNFAAQEMEAGLKSIENLIKSQLHVSTCYFEGFGIKCYLKDLFEFKNEKKKKARLGNHEVFKINKFIRKFIPWE